MSELLLALNCGSSSLKFQVAQVGDLDAPVLAGRIERIGADDACLVREGGEAAQMQIDAPDHGAAIDHVKALINTVCAGQNLAAAGHRIVHGRDFSQAMRVDADVFAALEAAVTLAPLHQPHGLAAIRAVEAAFPDAVNVAVFDTAFHARKPFVNDAYALPQKYFDHGLRRYGFHGISCQSITRSLQAQGVDLAARNLVIAHLGNGCSVTAVKGGVGHANSMGFSTLDGLAMGTRTGGIDPGVLLHLMDPNGPHGLSFGALEALLYKEAGLLGLSGRSNDMRDLEDAGDEASTGAIEYFVARASEEIARMGASMGGLDTVVFCGGIGENAPAIRDRIMAPLGFMRRADGAPIEQRVIATREEHEILCATRALL